MKTKHLLTALSISSFAGFLLFITFIETESKRLNYQLSVNEKRVLHSPVAAAPQNIIIVQERNPMKDVRQIKTRSCCSGTSKYLQINNYKAPIQ
jgi:hypothetical protein